MRNLIVINLGDGRCLSSAVGGKSAFSWVCEYARRLENAAEGIALIGRKDSPGQDGFRQARLAADTSRELVAALGELAAGCDNIIYVFGDSPFLDANLCLKMLDNHAKYYAHYTFADGYPAGLAPEIIAVRALPALAALCADTGEAVNRETLFTLIQKDINAFDLETELSPKDLRVLRASLTVDTERNRLLCERLAGRLGAEAPASEKIVSLLEEDPAIMRTLPAYACVQITDGCPQACMSCPYPIFGGDVSAKKGFMRTDDFCLITEKIAGFCGDAVIGVSLWGEPSLHPDFPGIARAVAAHPGLSLLVETSGIGWKDETLRAAAEALGSRLTWIVSLDAADAATYARLRGKGWEEASARANMLLAEFPGSSYVQSLRMADNEETLETFYRGWKEKTNNLIIQKYDWFCGFLPQRKVTDLSPLTRFPCRHLQRDISVLMDGRVPLCREDLKADEVLGNILTDSLEAIWEKGAARYQEHIAHTYTPLCGKCDEYYTYNF
ncbi:MAG: spiro-SPASM protein [Spirochaetaceae bacterium]|nr:spiro-SPASM protein [Spirochaetaceae bacterium]